ncbi:hypothetical protein PG984_016420 [Apiospora sp. TS-2023a]
MSSLPNPDPEEVDYFKVDPPGDPHPDPDTVDYFGFGGTNKEAAAKLPNPDPETVDYFKVDAPSDPNPDPDTVDYFEVEKTNKEPVDLPNPDPKDVDHPRIELPTAENPNPQGVDYYKELFDLFYGSQQYAFEELLTRFHALLSEITEARDRAGSNKSPLSIHDLVRLYAEYVDSFETVLKSSHYAAMLAEGRRYKSHERGYYEVIREQLQLTVKEKDNLDKIPEEQTVEPREKSSEEWNKHQALIRDMTNALVHFDDLFTVFQIAYPPPDTTPFTTERRVWHPQLRAVHKKLAKPLFGHHTETLWDHMSTIAKFLQTHRPDPADAWQEGGTLQSNAAFDATFEKFKALEDRKVWYDFQRKGLCRSSAYLLREACVDLQLDPDAVDIEWATLVDPTKLPSYTRVSIDQPEFIMGSPAEEGRPHHHNHSHMGMLQVKRALGYDPAKDPQVNTGAVQANTSKRRQSASGGEAGRPAKRQHTEAATHQHAEGTTSSSGGHAQQTWTRADADADFHWIESWLGSNPNGVDLSRAPLLDGSTVLKPLLTADVCDRWFYDFRTIRDQVEDLRDRVLAEEEAEEAGQEDRWQLLDELEDAIASARDELAQHRGRMNRLSQKRTRLAAIKLVYLRALAVRRATVLAEEARKGEGRAAVPCLDEHRARRLEDWVAHERAWLEAERFRMSQMKKKAPTAAHYAHLDRLGENISAWTREMAVLRARVADRQESGPEAHAAQAEQDAAAHAEEEEKAKKPAAALPRGGPDPKKLLNFLDQWFLRDFYTGTIFTNKHWDRLAGRPAIRSGSFLRDINGGRPDRDVAPPLAHPGGRGGLGSFYDDDYRRSREATNWPDIDPFAPGAPRVRRPADGDGVGEAAVHGGADALAVPGGLQLPAGAVHGEQGVGVAGADRARAASAGEEGVGSGVG